MLSKHRGQSQSPVSVTCREDQHCVTPQASLLQSQTDVSHCLIHGRHHACVHSTVMVFYEAVGGDVVLWHLQRSMDGLQSHVEEERLQDRK